MSTEVTNCHPFNVDCLIAVFSKLKKVDLSKLSEVDHFVSAIVKENLFWKPIDESSDQEERSYRLEHLREAKKYNSYFCKVFNLNMKKGNAFEVKKTIKENLRGKNLQLDRKVQEAISSNASFQEIRWLLKLGARVKERQIKAAIKGNAPADVVVLMLRNVDSVEAIIQQQGPLDFFGNMVKGKFLIGRRRDSAGFLNAKLN